VLWRFETPECGCAFDQRKSDAPDTAKAYVQDLCDSALVVMTSRRARLRRANSLLFLRSFVTGPFRDRAPAPPPSSSMNSTAFAISNATKNKQRPIDVSLTPTSLISSSDLYRRAFEIERLGLRAGPRWLIQNKKAARRRLFEFPSLFRLGGDYYAVAAAVRKEPDTGKAQDHHGPGGRFGNGARNSRPDVTNRRISDFEDGIFE
jgi:hypothetical protein